MKLLHRRVSQGETISFGEIHERSTEKNGSNLDLRIIHSGSEESEYVVIRENVDRDDPEFQPPEGSHFLGMTRNSNLVNRTHLWFATPLVQYGGDSE